MKKGRLIVLLVCLSTGLTAATTQIVARAGGPDVQASFTFSPVLPVSGETVTFTSTSTASGRNDRISSQQWDLDGDGSFDDGEGPIVSYGFAEAGTHTVGLRIADRQRGSDTNTQIVVVQRPAANLLKPFPIVQLSGTITRRGVRVRRLNVNAPKGVSVVVRCTGRRCPLRREIHSSSSRAGVVSISQLQRRFLRAGIKLKVYVTKPPMIGKYTRFTIKRLRPPRRIDRCMIPGRAKPTRCPS
jgi:hypothetical protein